MMLIDIAKYLHDQGVGVYDEDGTGGNIFIGMLPDTPDACISILGTGGQGPSLSASISYPSFQIITRDDDYLLGSARAKAIEEALHGTTEQLLNGTRYHLIQALQEPVDIGLDRNQRREWSQNFRVIKERS